MSLIGKRFGRWVVTEVGEPYTFPSTGRKATRYICECECGTVKLVRESSLLNSESTSCGCFAKEQSSKRATTHGSSRHKLYNTWNDMLRRCYDSSRKDYKHYGGRGISVCDEWRDRVNGFDCFLTDMLVGHEDSLEIDRIDVNGNYCKENCRWVTRREQVINRRPMGSGFDANLVTYQGKTLCLSQWEEVTGINRYVLSDRLTKLNWVVEKALTVPVKVKQYFVIVKDNKIPIEDVFKNVPNLYYHAKKNNTTFQEFLAGLFYEKFTVTGIVNKQEIEFKPTKDFSHLLDFNKLKDGFKSSAEEFFAGYGVEI